MFQGVLEGCGEAVAAVFNPFDSSVYVVGGGFHDSCNSGDWGDGEMVEKDEKKQLVGDCESFD